MAPPPHDSARERPTDDLSTDGRPIHERPTDERPTDDQLATGSPHLTREDVLLETFSSLAAGLATRTVSVALGRLLDRSLPLLGTTHAGLVFHRQRGRVEVHTDSGADGAIRELLQADTADNPGLVAIRTGEPVLVDDLVGGAARRPRWAAMAADRHVRSVHVLPVRVHDPTVGALVLLGDGPRRLGPREQRVAQALADVAVAVAVTDDGVRSAEELTAQLQTALESRIVIEQAKGIVAATLRVSVDEAFVVMRNHSRSTNRRVVDLATDLTTGRTGVGVFQRDQR